MAYWTPRTIKTLQFIFVIFSAFQSWTRVPCYLVDFYIVYFEPRCERKQFQLLIRHLFRLYFESTLNVQHSSNSAVLYCCYWYKNIVRMLERGHSKTFDGKKLQLKELHLAMGSFSGKFYIWEVAGDLISVCWDIWWFHLKVQIKRHYPGFLIYSDKSDNIYPFYNNL